MMVSEIPRLVTRGTKQNYWQNQTSGGGKEIALLREETKVKIEKMEKMLEDFNRQLKKSACHEDNV